MVQGVGKGFTRVLEINGVGYRAEARGNILFLTLGYSHPIAFQLPAGHHAKVERQVVVTLEGATRAARPGGRGDPRAPPARALQGQGRQVRRGDDPQEGRQDGAGATR
jgi:large subunit ribosomal protein L6